MTLDERCTEIADRVVPQYRKMDLTYSCTGHWAKRWQAAWDAACVALGESPDLLCIVEYVALVEGMPTVVRRPIKDLPEQVQAFYLGSIDQ